MDYVRQLLLTQMRKQRPAAVQTEMRGSVSGPGSQRHRPGFHPCSPSLPDDPSLQQEQYRLSVQRSRTPGPANYQNLKEDDGLSLWTSPGLLAIPHPRGRLLSPQDISVPVAPAPAMADTYAAVQKRGAPAGARPGSRARSADEAPVYSQVTPRAQRPGTHAEDTRTALPGCVPADQSPAGSGAYEDVTDGAQTSGLGFNLRIGRPKGPRDPPADWSQV
ncbi:tyrosine-protein phosphatase non-receptor type 18 isoform X1 [Microcebus murinus]|uniref:tyrosine-protein phosphatase non-receptor type 18 isoform X1 n=1 Tax=Microcebus murinus TaxID=30608 RepID=UPI003F6BC7CE